MLTRGYIANLAPGLVSALVFFTRLPVGRWYRDSPTAAADAMVYAPLVGVLLGLACGGLLLALGLALSSGLSAALALAFAVLVTGALHEDAFADYCDGFGAGGDAERVLEIMRDPRCGSFGVTGLVLVLVIEVAALAELHTLHGADRWPALVLALVLAHAASRFAATAFMAFSSRAGEASSKLGSIAAPMPRAQLLGASVPVLLVLLLMVVLAPWLLPAVIAAPLAAWWLGRQFLPRLGGYSGDCLGAVQKLAEAGTLVACAACAGLA